MPAPIALSPLDVQLQANLHQRYQETTEPHLLELLPRADLYLQDEVQFAFHPTLTRLWSLKGRRSQRLIEAPGDNRKAYGFPFEETCSDVLQIIPKFCCHLIS